MEFTYCGLVWRLLPRPSDPAALKTFFTPSGGRIQVCFAGGVRLLGLDAQKGARRFWTVLPLDAAVTALTSLPWGEMMPRLLDHLAEHAECGDLLAQWFEGVA